LIDERSEIHARVPEGARVPSRVPIGGSSGAVSGAIGSVRDARVAPPAREVQRARTDHGSGYQVGAPSESLAPPRRWWWLAALAALALLAYWLYTRSGHERAHRVTTPSTSSERLRHDRGPSASLQDATTPPAAAIGASGVTSMSPQGGSVPEPPPQEE